MEGEEDDTSPLILVATRLVEALNVAKNHENKLSGGQYLLKL